MSTYEKLIGCLGELQPYFLAEGFKVYNCNPDSRLKVFPFEDYKVAVEGITANIGDTDKERSSGLYSKYEEKMAEFSPPKTPIPDGRRDVAVFPAGARPPMPHAPVMPPTPQGHAPKVFDGIPVDMGWKGD